MTEATLCPVVEGLVFYIDFLRKPIRVLILREALEAAFGAGPSPESWLETFEAHQGLITGIASAIYTRAPHGNFLLLRARHFDDLQRHVIPGFEWLRSARLPVQMNAAAMR
jgi:hypothetical protein